jgi:hypothetical protein
MPSETLRIPIAHLSGRFQIAPITSPNITLAFAIAFVRSDERIASIVAITCFGPAGARCDLARSSTVPFVTTFADATFRIVPVKLTLTVAKVVHRLAGARFKLAQVASPTTSTIVAQAAGANCLQLSWIETNVGGRLAGARIDLTIIAAEPKITILALTLPDRIGVDKKLFDHWSAVAVANVVARCHARINLAPLTAVTAAGTLARALGGRHFVRVASVGAEVGPGLPGARRCIFAEITKVTVSAITAFARG